jgi:hypothetical protein
LQNVTIACRCQGLLPFIFVTNVFLSLFSTNYSSILPYFMLPFISWSTSHCCFSRFIYNTVLGILFSSIFCTCPNHRNLCKFIVSVRVGFFISCINLFIS